MLDHYYTLRDLPLGPQDRLLNTIPLDHLDPNAAMLATNFDAAKPHPAPPQAAPENKSDNGYVSMPPHIQRTPVPVVIPRTAQKIAGVRRVACAVSMLQPVHAATMGSMLHVGWTMDIDVMNEVDFGWGAQANSTEMVTATNLQVGCSVPEGELFQSITAIPGLQSSSFEVCCAFSFCLASFFLLLLQWAWHNDESTLSNYLVKKLTFVHVSLLAGLLWSTLLLLPLFLGTKYRPSSAA
ncbi:hypothetical protein B0H19DRAFT_1245937 [Mycena capillaripes]|nr:hypothetical protein B0H19DRAFT_1245937 [Mycena capillaripes]